MTCDWNNVCELVHNFINEKTKVAGHVGLMDLNTSWHYKGEIKLVNLDLGWFNFKSIKCLFKIMNGFIEVTFYI
jgi:hypothetical protein